MLVGLLSDSHGRAAITRAAVDLLRSRGAAHLIHCGDVGDYGHAPEPVIDALACGPDCPAAFVWGNNDDPDPAVAAYAAALGVSCLGDAGTLDLGGRRFGVTHGDRPALVRRLLSGGLDYLCVGHSHVADDRRSPGGTTRVLNPGALFRASAKTVALLDTDADRVEFIGIPLPG